jgi:putative spermidine/putrescine transport system ATP-binding protein
MLAKSEAEGLGVAGVVESAPAGLQHLVVRDVTKRYRDLTVLDTLNLTIEKGEIVSLLGPSGCGKTTLLRAIAGLTDAGAGSIKLAGREITRVAAHRRNVGVVFQSYALFPHLTVAENIAFGLKARGAPRAEIPDRVTASLRMVRMTELANRSITALSGGQQQRVAVARALVVEPEMLLLDEPFSALDRKLRETMQVELKSLLREKGMTAIFVTHDQEEALALSNRIAVMNKGKIEQFADPVTLYEQPATSFVLEFVGLSTRIAGRVAAASDGMVDIETAYGMVRGKGKFAPGSNVVAAVRPELISAASAASTASANRITVPLQEVMCLGSKTHLYGTASEGDFIIAELSGTAPLTQFKPGDHATLAWPTGSTLVFPAEAK